MFRSILVLVRNSPADDAAVARARLLGSTGSAIEVLDVVHEPLLDGYLGNREIYEPLRRRVVEERQQRAAALAESLAGESVTATGTAVWDHPLEEAVERAIQRRRADLVITSPLPSDRGGLAHSDWRLILASSVPVLMVKGDVARRYRHVVAAVDPFHAHAKPAHLDDTILVNATAVCARTGASLTVLHCHTPLSYFGAELGVSRRGLEEKRLEALHELLDAAGVPRTAARIVEGQPHVVLERMLDGGEADLVVMGALARGRLKELAVGSTAERVLHRTRGDVLVVKPAARFMP